MIVNFLILLARWRGRSKASLMLKGAGALVSTESLAYIFEVLAPVLLPAMKYLTNPMGQRALKQHLGDGKYPK